MSCRNCEKNTVWEFTNKTKLCKNCFTDYLERKIFKTIRKYSMLPESREIKLKKSANLNAKVLESILKSKFKINYSNKPDFSSKNLSDISEEIFSNILRGKFTGVKPQEKISFPLYFITDKEIELYAKLKSIEGKKIKRNLKVQELFKKFLEKNPDLEHNIVNAFLQI
jgi:hypothetical protein